MSHSGEIWNNIAVFVLGHYRHKKPAIARVFCIFLVSVARVSYASHHSDYAC